MFKNIALFFSLVIPSTAMAGVQAIQNAGGGVSADLAVSTLSATTAVGVSTTAPVWPLTVVYSRPTGLNLDQTGGTTVNTGMFWTDDAAASNTVVIRNSIRESTAINRSASLILESNGRATSTNFTGQVSSGTWGARVLTDQNGLAVVAMSGRVWSGSSYPLSGRIVLRTEGVPASATNIPTSWIIETASTGTVTASEKVRVEANGGFRMYVRSKAEIDAMTPNQLGSQIVCSDCTVPYDVCISTGLTLSGYRATLNSAINTATPGTLVPKGCGTNE